MNDPNYKSFLDPVAEVRLQNDKKQMLPQRVGLNQSKQEEILLSIGQLAQFYQDGQIDQIILIMHELNQQISYSDLVIPYIYNEQFALFLLDCLENINDEQCINETLEIIYSFCESSYFPGLFFVQHDILRYAFSFISSENPKISYSSFGIINETLFLFQNQNLPFSVPGLLEQCQYLRVKSHEIEKQIAIFLFYLVIYTPYQEYLIMILDIANNFIDIISDKESESAIVRMYHALIQSDTNIYRQLKHLGQIDKLISCFLRYDLEKSNDTFLKYFTTFIADLLNYLAPEECIEIYSKIGFNNIRKLYSNKVCEDSKYKSLYLFTRYAEILSTYDLKEFIEFIIHIEFIETVLLNFDKGDFDTKKLVLKFIWVMLQFQNISIYEQIMERDYIGLVLDLAEAANNICVLECYVETVCLLFSIASLCNEIPLIKQQIDQHNVSDVLNSIYEQGNEEVDAIVIKYFNEVDSYLTDTDDR